MGLRCSEREKERQLKHLLPGFSGLIARRLKRRRCYRIAAVDSWPLTEVLATGRFGLPLLFPSLVPPLWIWWRLNAASQTRVRCGVCVYKGWLPLRREKGMTGLVFVESSSAKRCYWVWDANMTEKHIWFSPNKSKHRAGVLPYAKISKGCLQEKWGEKNASLFSLLHLHLIPAKAPSLTGNKLDNSLTVHCSISILSCLIQSFWI